MYAWSLDMPATPAMELGGTRFRKELIHVGKFQKDGVVHDVDEALLDHWNTTFKVFSDRGIEVPLPNGHTVDPEAKRGKIVGMERGKNSKGQEALFGIVDFKTAELANQLKDSQVSIFVPPSSEDSDGNKYHRPITHVAITDYPVVRNLDGFEVLAASLVEEGVLSMSLRTLAEALKIDGDDARDDVAIESRIKSLFSDLKAEIKELKAKAKEPPAKPEPVPVAASHLEMLADNRSLKLDRLVSTGKLTPAARKKIEERWCSKDALTLAFSNDTADDGFNAVLAVFDANEPVIAFGENTSRQTLTDPSVTDPAKNPLLRNAKARQDAS